MKNTKKIKLAIVDYGLGNQKSLQCSCRQLNHRAVISNEFNVLDQADVLLLPGVGAFGTAMNNLHDLGLVEYIQNASKQEEDHRNMLRHAVIDRTFI